MTRYKNIMQPEPESKINGVEVIDQFYLTYAQAATYLGMGVSTLERLRTKGTGPLAHKLGSKAVRFRICDLDAWAMPTNSTSQSHQ